MAAEDADDLAGGLADPVLYGFIGDPPDSAASLADRYRRLAGATPPPGEQWHNWVVRAKGEAEVIGTVQATVAEGTGWVAWIIGVPWQGRRFATEAAGAVVEWLWSEGVEMVAAAIHPGHEASMAVAAAVGLRRTDEIVEGEVVWRARRLDLAGPGRLSPSGRW